MTGVYLFFIMIASMKDLHFLRLWDIYNGLLTNTQREITDLYYNCDLSLAEIAEEKGCSRQSVSECLATCRKQFEEYEERLHFLRILTEASLNASFLATDIERTAEAFPEEYRKKLTEILQRDYSQEIASAIEKNKDTLL